MNFFRKESRVVSNLRHVLSLIGVLAYGAFRDEGRRDYRIGVRSVEDAPLAIDRYRWTQGGTC